MPNRILREGILTSPRMARLGWAEEVFYRRLMSVVDDFGRYYADEGLLRAACYPRQLNKVSDSDVGKWLRACVDAALVRVYPAQDGERYLELRNFGQQVRAKKSKFPEVTSECYADATQTHSQCAADAHLDVSEDEDVNTCASGDARRNGRCTNGEDFERFWSVYPRKKNKGDAEKAWAKIKPSGEFLERILQSVEAARGCDDWTKEGGKFVPYPASWLNAKGWEDEIPSASHESKPWDGAI